MGLRAKPTQRQRRLGYELRRLREASGLTGPEAGAYIDVGRAHMSHIEAGRTHIPEQKLRVLVEVYGCKSASYVDELAAMTRATGKGWWTDYKRIVSDGARDLAELEASSVVHRSFQLLYVPGLLQTEAYIRKLLANGEPDAPAARIDRYVAFRRQRQSVLTEDPPPQFHAVIHEAAFHMRYLGRDVMREQIQHVVDLSRQPNIHIQLLPFKASCYPSTASTPFVVFESAARELRTVYIEHPVSSVYLADETHTAQFSREFEQLSHASLSPMDTTETHPQSSHGLAQYLLYDL